MINDNSLDAAQPHIAGLKSIKQELEPGIYAYCTCGWSSSQPFCDSSCNGTHWKPLILDIAERQKISFCTCKHSLKGYICDGTHKRIAMEIDEAKKSHLP